MNNDNWLNHSRCGYKLDENIEGKHNIMIGSGPFEKRLEGKMNFKYPPQNIEIGKSILPNGNYCYNPFEDNQNLNTNKTMEKEKKYVAPFDIYEGNILKGDIFVIDNSFLIKTYMIEKGRSKWTLPGEVVESWKEYIEPKKLITMDDIEIFETIIINEETKAEYGCTSKSIKNNTVLAGTRWYAIKEINENFTIKE